MKNRLFLILAAIFVVGSLTTARVSGQTTIYVVRHAEKVTTPGARNPVLSASGTKRAHDLARALRSAKVEVCLATQFKRTALTVAPTAKLFGHKVTSYAAGKEQSLAKQLVKDYVGKTVLVAGHSNTVPAILSGLGVKTKLTLSDNDYDDLFQVIIGKDGKVSFTHLHYGAANPAK